MRAYLALALSPLLVLGLTRCSSFSTATPGSPPSPDAAIAAEASTDASDDAGPTHDPGGTCTATTTICATFDTADWTTNGWSPVGEATEVGWDPNEYGDAPGSLLVNVPANGDAGFYRYGLPTGKRSYVMQAKIKFAMTGDGEIDFFGFRFGTEGELRFIHSKNAGSFAVELDAGKDPPILMPIYVANPGSWNDVRLELSYDTKKFRLTVGSEEQSGAVPETFPQAIGPIFFDVGAPYANEITKRWLYSIDDVAVDAQ